MFNINIDSSRPRPAAAIPFSGTRPAKMATIDNPRIVIINISGRAKASTIGRAMRMKNVRNTAPTRPPKSDDAKAADKALAA